MYGVCIVLNLCMYMSLIVYDGANVAFVAIYMASD